MLAAARRLAPHAHTEGPLPALPKRRPPARQLPSWVVVIAAVAASSSLEAAGYPTLSWIFDSVAVAGYLALRVARRPSRLSVWPR